MKIKVADLRPNPFREIGKYPIDRDKIERLKRSIKDTSFWDNILCRQNNGSYEIAYGHHRLETLRELEIDEVDIPVKDLTDAQMVRIMAEENLEWLTSPKVVNQTILSVKKYLDGELKRLKTVKQLLTADKSISGLFSKDPNRYGQQRKEGVGRETLLKFLGGNWKEWMIQSALATKGLIEEGVLDKEAIESLPTIDQANAFRGAVKNNKIPKPIQRNLAKDIVKKKIGSKHIPLFVRKAAPVELQSNESPEFLLVKKTIEKIDSQSRQLINQLMLLRRQMQVLEVQEFSGAKVCLANSSLNRLFKEMERLKERTKNETYS